jgi:hypothetical protein
LLRVLVLSSLTVVALSYMFLDIAEMYIFLTTTEETPDWPTAGRSQIPTSSENQSLTGFNIQDRILSSIEYSLAEPLGKSADLSVFDDAHSDPELHALHRKTGLTPEIFSKPIKPLREDTHSSFTESSSVHTRHSDLRSPLRRDHHKEDGEEEGTNHMETDTSTASSEEEELTSEEVMRRRVSANDGSSANPSKPSAKLKVQTSRQGVRTVPSPEKPEAAEKSWLEEADESPVKKSPQQRGRPSRGYHIVGTAPPGPSMSSYSPWSSSEQEDEEAASVQNPRAKKPESYDYDTIAAHIPSKEEEAAAREQRRKERCDMMCNTVRQTSVIFL